MSKQTKSEEPIPIFGRPLWYVSSNNLFDLMKERSLKSRIRSSVNHLQYFASEGVFVKKVEYKDDSLDAAIINKDTDMEQVVERKDIGSKFFLSKEECDEVAVRMNEEMKEDLHLIATEAMELYHNIDEIIEAHLRDNT